MFAIKKVYLCFIVAISFYLTYLYYKAGEKDVYEISTVVRNHDNGAFPSTFIQRSPIIESRNDSGISTENDRSQCPQGNVITVGNGGQLGNKIWEYMSLFSAYNLYKDTFDLVAFVPRIIKEDVETVFENTSLPLFEDIPMECHVGQRKKVTVGYNSLISKEMLPQNEKVLIELLKWSAKYEFVVPFGFENVKKELRFKKNLVKLAEQNLHSIKDKFYKSDDNDVSFVGMHYRGTDMVNLMQTRLRNKFTKPPNYEYFNAAISYFQQKYEKVIFILITVDYKWLRENKDSLKSDINLVVNPVQPESALNDLSLLSHCNHSIITYGTYATTAALYTGGTTFVFDLGIPLDFNGPTLTMGLVAMLPNWYKIRNRNDLVIQGLLPEMKDTLT